MKKISKKASMDLKSVLGPLWKLYNDPKCWEIIIDSFESVYTVYQNEFVHQKVFKNQKELSDLITRLLKFGHKDQLKNEYSFYIPLDEFSRVVLVLPPLSINGANLVFTKLPQKNVSLNDLKDWGVITTSGLEKIQSILKSGQGFIVAGNMGSGKTTLLNTLINELPQNNRVVTLERFANLVLKRPVLTRLQTQSQTTDEMIELIRLVDMLRADYTVLADLVGPELGSFLEMLRSNSTGIMLTTGISPQDTLQRLITKAVISSEGFNIEEANYALSQCFKYLIFQEKRSDGKRVISSICELNFEKGEIKFKNILDN